jgi:hypothetical protein
MHFFTKQKQLKGTRRDKIQHTYVERYYEQK